MTRLTALYRRRRILGPLLVSVVVGLLGIRLAGRANAADYATPNATNMILVGQHDLEGREAYWPTVHKQQGRYLVYVGIQSGSAVNSLTGVKENSGVMILDVTDPKQPRELAHIAGPPPPDAGGTEHVRVCDGTELPNADKSKVYMVRSYGRSGHQLWDVTTPEKPALIRDIVMGLRSTHKSWWDCKSGMAYLVGGPEGWSSTQIMMVYDISNPADVKHVRDFGLAGMEPGGTGEFKQPLHGPVMVGNRVYLAWGFNARGVIQIVDNDKLLHGDPTVADPLAPTAKNLAYPEVGRLRMPDYNGAHTTFPVLKMTPKQFANDKQFSTRDYLVTVSEATGNLCASAQHMAWMVDITDEAHPFPVSNLSTDESAGAYCAAGGRFGTHASSETFDPRFYKKMVLLSYLNAGLRAFDIRDPLHPKEVASYVPAANKNTIPFCKPGSTTDCTKVISTNGVDVDDRGNIYIVDRVGTGLHVLQVTGAAKSVLDSE